LAWARTGRALQPDRALEVKVEAKRRGVELVILPTDRALDCFTHSGHETNAILHVTC
jgi:hypothetical protein